MNLDRLAAPGPTTRIFVPTPDKLATLAHKLRTEKFWLSDEYRATEAVRQIVVDLVGGAANSMFYEVGDFDAVIGFMAIIPGWKATLTFKLVKGEAFTPRFVRECKGVIGAVMDEFGLVRIGTSSPDERIVRMARMVGFKTEGIRAGNFSWDGTLYDDVEMGLTRLPKEG